MSWFLQHYFTAVITVFHTVWQLMARDLVWKQMDPKNVGLLEYSPIDTIANKPLHWLNTIAGKRLKIIDGGIKTVKSAVGVI